MGEVIPIIGDVPSNDPKIGFESYATALADAIRGGSPAQFTIGIYGEWGSGKSSLLNAIAGQLKKHEPTVLTVLFDAWRYETTSHIIVPLLYAIYNKIPEFGDNALTDKVGHALVSIVRSLTFKIGPVSVSGSGLLGRKSSEKAQLDAEFARPYADMKAITAALKGRRIAVLIDDLDRCSSGNMIAVLEAINLVMDMPGFVFVLALDYEALTKAIEVHYPHVSGHVFIEKMVQVPFRVPRLDLPEDGFLVQLIPGWSEIANTFPDDFEQIVRDVAREGLEANPRQIKRLVNLVMVLLRVAEDRKIATDPRLLAGLVGMQLQWPVEYQILTSAVLESVDNPFALITGEDQTRLSRYCKKFFPEDSSSNKLRPYLQLTQSVVVPTPQVTEVGRVKWFDAQKGFGFIESASLNEEIFVHISAVERAGLRGLKEGQLVRFQVVRENGRASAAQLVLV